MKKIILSLSLLSMSILPCVSEETKTEEITKEESSIPNKDVAEGKWQAMKGKIMKKWAKITEDDLLHLKGTREELIGKVKEKYGYTKKKAAKLVDKFLKENKE